jgi:hypothetical protein
VGKRRGSRGVDVIRLGCGVVGGAEVYHPVSHECGGSEGHQVEGAGEGLRVPLKPQCQGQQLLWRSSRER